MQVEDPAPAIVLAEMRKWGQRMDYADACAVLLARRHKGSVVLTTDHRIFPFIACLSFRRRASFTGEELKSGRNSLAEDQRTTPRPPSARPTASTSNIIWMPWVFRESRGAGYMESNNGFPVQVTTRRCPARVNAM